MKHSHTFSSKETKRFAEQLARAIVRRKSKTLHRRSAVVIALTGDLGSGKTTFVQGFLCGLGVRRRATSPTFVLIKRFKLHVSGFKNVYHADAYRIKASSELVKLGIREIFSDPHNIVLIEWAERVRHLLPKRAIRISFAHGARINERTIALRCGL